jgi:RHS repeat-associated protein
MGSGTSYRQQPEQKLKKEIPMTAPKKKNVLTEEQKTDAYPAATMENANIETERMYYGNLTNTQYDKPSWFSDPLYTENYKVARIKNEDGSLRIGPNIMLKVMAGDSYSIRVAGGWQSKEGNNDGDAGNILNELLGLVSNGLATNSGGKATALELQNNTGLNSALSSFINGQTSTDPTYPKSYLNWILFDEQFKMVANISGFTQVGASESTTELATKPNVYVDKSGFLYIYTSNQSKNIDVYFDNLQITHTRGALLEENHYYPFGLTMAGISSKAANMRENKIKYQQYELNTDFDINLYESFYRSHDPQLGRFWQIDPKPNPFESLYAAMGNNPISKIDLLGDTTWVYDKNGALALTINDSKKNQIHFGIFENEKDSKPITISGENANMEATWWRKNSTAFIGDNTIKDMKSIVEKANAISKELAFVGTVGNDREIRLKAMPFDKELNFHSSVLLGKQLDKNYSKEEQANLFLVGHIHHNKGENGGTQTYGDGKVQTQFDHFGRPSYPADYGPYLYRSANAENRGQSPALIVTQWGVSVYGTATSAVNNGYFVDVKGAVVNENSSYLFKRIIK